MNGDCLSSLTVICIMNNVAKPPPIWAAPEVPKPAPTKFGRLRLWTWKGETWQFFFINPVTNFYSFFQWTEFMIKDRRLIFVSAFSSDTAGAAFKRRGSDRLWNWLQLRSCPLNSGSSSTTLPVLYKRKGGEVNVGNVISKQTEVLWNRSIAFLYL